MLRFGERFISSASGEVEGEGERGAITPLGFDPALPYLAISSHASSHVRWLFFTLTSMTLTLTTTFAKHTENIPPRIIGTL